jgi:hypothetical protein
MQTIHGCYDVLQITEYSGTNGSLEQAPGTTVHLVEEEDRIKLAKKLTTGINTYIFTRRSHKPFAHIQGDYHSTMMYDTWGIINAVFAILSNSQCIT